MPVTMGGLASGMDTDAIIKKLVQVEAQPMRQLEQSKRVYDMKKNALNQLSTKLKKLESKAKNLYGFRAEYDAKKSISSDTSVIEATASKNAIIGDVKVEVLQVASAHKISSDKLSSEEKLPPGKFIIEVKNEKRALRFKGGSLKALSELVAEEASELVSSSYIKTSGTDYILTLSSKTSGKPGQIRLSGDNDLLKKTGFIKGEKISSRDDKSIVYDRKYFSSYAGKNRPEGDNGSLEVTSDGKKLKMTGQLWQEYEIPLSVDIKEDTVLRFNYRYLKQEEERIPLKVEMGPEDEINVKGIRLKSYNISRFRQLPQDREKKYDSIAGIGVISKKGDKIEEKIYPVAKDSAKGQEFPVGKDFSGQKIIKMIYYCNTGTAEFSDTSFSTPVKEKNEFEYKNVIAEARNTKLKVDGVEVEREKSSELNDVVKGVSLNVKGKSKRPVELKISPDVDKPIKSIKEFVEAYNDYLDFHRKLTKAVKSDKPDNKKNKTEESGIFVGDMTLVRLENHVKSTVNDAYSSRAEKPVKMFSQMGVSTGKINANWESIKQGKLVVDEDELRTAIVENPEGVTMFFGADTDGDNKTDTGMGFTLVRVLGPYVSFGKNIIKTKIEQQDNSIKMANERLERMEDHLKEYEKKLRAKFGAMERSISGSKAQQQWMKNQMGGSSSGKE